MKKVLLARQQSAIGDSILFSDVVHNINVTYPDVLIDVPIQTGFEYTKIMYICGCRFRLVMNPKYEEYDNVVLHSIYSPLPKIKDKHIVISMYENVLSDLDLPIEDGYTFELVYCLFNSQFELPGGDYIIVPSLEETKSQSLDKEYKGYDEIAKGLSDICPVYELNTSETNTKTLENTAGVLHTQSFIDTAKILNRAKFSVTIENGLNHWACHNKGRTFCIFNGDKRRATPKECFYPTMTPIDCHEDSSPEFVIKSIKENL